MQWKNTETPTFAGSNNTAAEGPDVVETMQLLDRGGNVVATFTKQVDGSYVFTPPATVAGSTLQGAHNSGSVEITTEDYADEGSYQPIWADLNLAAGAGTSDEGDSSYLAAIMGNVLGAVLTKVHNVIGGLIGKYSVTGGRASTYPLGGVIGEIGDGVSEADGAVVAVLGGDSEQTNARAAFTVDNQNSTPGSSFEYGLDLRGVDHDDFGLVEYSEGDIRFRDGSVQSKAAGNTFETPTGTVDGVNDEFIFTKPPIFVTYQGVIQDLTEDYTVVGSTVTFLVPPVSGTVKGLVSA